MLVHCFRGPGDVYNSRGRGTRLRENVMIYARAHTSSAADRLRRRAVTWRACGDSGGVKSVRHWRWWWRWQRALAATAVTVAAARERIRAPPEVYPCRDLTSCRFRSATAAADTFRHYPHDCTVPHLHVHTLERARTESRWSYNGGSNFNFKKYILSTKKYFLLF